MEQSLITLLNIIATLTSTVALVIFFRASLNFSEELRTCFRLFAFGIFAAITFHSITESLESFGIVETTTLFIIMPILVTIGSIVIIYSGIFLERIIVSYKSK